MHIYFQGHFVSSHFLFLIEYSYKSIFFLTQLCVKYENKMFEISQAITLVLLTLFINQCSSQTGFPKQFQATLNITGLQSYTTRGIQQLLYDYTNSRVRFDIKGWRLKQNETYMVQYKPKGAEPNTVNKNSAFLYGKST